MNEYKSSKFISSNSMKRLMRESKVKLYLDSYIPGASDSIGTD